MKTRTCVSVPSIYGLAKKAHGNDGDVNSLRVERTTQPGSQDKQTAD